LLAHSYLLAGRYEDAFAAARDTRELARRYHERGPEAWALYLIAASMAQLQRGDRTEIYDDYLAALKSADELGMRPLVAHCRLGLGRLDQQGKRKETREHFMTATTMYREMDMEFWLERANVEMRELA
jgi:tetratricopeptide (TPR) repeat protein